MPRLALITASVLLLAIPAKPQGKIFFGQNGKPAVLLTWTASSGATGYNIYRNAVAIGTTTSTEFVDGTILRKTTYSYTVTSVASGFPESGPSNTVTVTTP